MKDLEFRAWLKDRMVKVEGFDFEYKYIEYKECDDDDYVDYANFYEIELMQYTGLKDKNGVKIFEGDIVKVDYLQEKIFEIIFVNGGFKLKAKDCSTEYDYSITSTMIEENAIEIIGNVWENPKLLEIK